MLRRVENVSPKIGWQGIVGFTEASSGWLHVFIGRKVYSTSLWMDESEFEKLNMKSESSPVKYWRDDDKTLWRFQDRWYWDNEGLSKKEVFAVLTARAARAKNSIDRAKSIAGFVTTHVTGNRRGHISPDLRQLVWLRDNGACTNCGSNIELQFDHIIPVAMGGATNEENLQILCGSCNRTKGNSVG